MILQFLPAILIFHLAGRNITQKQKWSYDASFWYMKTYICFIIHGLFNGHTLHAYLEKSLLFNTICNENEFESQIGDY